VSTGIVSALYRSTVLSSSSGNTVYSNLIQIDAAINQGNSGGALVNNKGQLVGINTLLESTSGDFSGIGFSIPGNYAVSIAKKIIAGETVTHAYIGLSMLTVNSQNAKSNNLSVNSGAYVAEVTSGGPADKAGIKQGDIITKIDDTTITSADGMIIAVRSHEEGDVVTVTFNRNGTEQSVQVTLGNDEQLQEEQQQQEKQQNSLLEEFGYGNNSSNSAY
jgi:putative serine protease PepD